MQRSSRRCPCLKPAAQLFCRLGTARFGFTCCCQVDLQFRFRSGRPNDRLHSFFQEKAKHVGLRQAVDPLPVWLEKYHPDAVVMAYSLQMLRDDNYAFE